MKKIDIQLIQKAQSGQQEALSVLSELVRDKILIFIYRITLDFHLAEDLTQETILEMVRSRERLIFNHLNFFWAWIHRTALGKIQHHYRIQGNKRIRSKTIMDNDRLKQVAVQDETGINKLVKKEQIQAVCDAISKLNLAYRSILTLRCFEKMSYPEIAAVTSQTELQARVQFFRAKQSLKKHLVRRGFDRDYLSGALGLFGAITLGSSQKVAAVTIAPKTLQIGIGTAVVATIFSKAVVIILSILATAAIASNLSLIPKKTNISPSDPYLDLKPLLTNIEFTNPSYVVGAYDPENDGFRVVDTFERSNPPFEATPEQVFINNQSDDNIGLILPDSHWIELGFAGNITNSSGPDLFLTGWGCRAMLRVFLTDAAEQVYELERLNCIKRCLDYHILSFDIEKLPLMFEPRAVRIQGVSDWGRNRGFEVCTVRARIEQSANSQ